MESVSFFFKPLPLAAVFMMALNDHVLKHHFGNWWTGKLSDFMGMFYFPIFLAALVLLLLHSLEKPKALSRQMALWCIAFSMLLLIAVKASPLTAAVIEAFFSNYLFQIRIVPDPTDLLALLMCIPAYHFLSAHAKT